MIKPTVWEVHCQSLSKESADWLEITSYLQFEYAIWSQVWSIFQTSNALTHDSSTFFNSSNQVCLSLVSRFELSIAGSRATIMNYGGIRGTWDGNMNIWAIFVLTKQIWKMRQIAYAWIKVEAKKGKFSWVFQDKKVMSLDDINRDCSLEMEWWKIQTPFSHCIL